MIDNRFEMTYGSTVIGGSETSRLFVNRYTTTRGHRFFEVEADVFVEEAGDAAFIATCNALELEFRTPRQRLQVTMNGSTIEDFNPATAVNSGFDAEPSIEKLGERADTTRSRLYRISVRVTLSAEVLGQDGRDLDATITIEESPAQQRTVTFRGTYTAIAGTDADDTYEANAVAYADAYLASKFPGPPAPEWDRVNPRLTTLTDSGKEITYELVYLEVLEGKTGSSAPDFNDPEIREHSLVVIRSQDGGREGQINGERGVPRQNYRVLFSAFVDRDRAQDLQDKWDSDVVPWMQQEAARITGAGDLVVVQAVPRFDPTTSRFEGELTLETGVFGSLNRATVTFRLRITGGYRFMPLADGDPDTFDVFEGKRAVVRTIMINREFIGGPSEASVVGPSGIRFPSFSGALSPSGLVWYPIDLDVSGAEGSYGIPRFGSQETYRVDETWIFRGVKGQRAVQQIRDLQTVARDPGGVQGNAGNADLPPRGGVNQAQGAQQGQNADQSPAAQPTGRPSGGARYSDTINVGSFGGSPSGLDVNIQIPGGFGLFGIQ